MPKIIAWDGTSVSLSFVLGCLRMAKGRQILTLLARVFRRITRVEISTISFRTDLIKVSPPAGARL